MSPPLRHLTSAVLQVLLGELWSLICPIRLLPGPAQGASLQIWHADVVNKGPSHRAHLHATCGSHLPGVSAQPHLSWLVKQAGLRPDFPVTCSSCPAAALDQPQGRLGRKDSSSPRDWPAQSCLPTSGSPRVLDLDGLLNLTPTTPQRQQSRSCPGDSDADDSASQAPLGCLRDNPTRRRAGVWVPVPQLGKLGDSERPCGSPATCSGAGIQTRWSRLLAARS